MITYQEARRTIFSDSFRVQADQELKVVRRDRRSMYECWGSTFENMTTAIIFLLLIEAGDLRGAVEWKERYSI